jgi:type I restriction enzyme S subunit
MNDIVNGIYQSWFSKDYPKDWKISRLKELISGIRKEKNKSEDTPVISLTINGVKIKNNLSEGMNPKTYIGHQLVYPGDLVICLRDLDGPLLVGISEHYGCTSNLYVVLQFDEQNLDYYNYIFKTMDYLRVIDDFSYGMRHSYNISQFCQLRLPAPQLLIQNKIVQKLIPVEQKIDQLINNQQQQIEKLKEYKQSLISEVVTKGLNPNVELKDSGIDWIGKIPTQWSVYKIKSLFATIGSGTTPNSVDEYLYKDEVNWIQSGDLGTKYLKTVSKKVSEDALNSISTLRIYKSPFVVIAMYGASIGSLSISKIDSCTNQACCVLAEPKNIINIEYVYYFIQSTKEALVLHGKGGTQPNISQDTIKRFFITLPPLSEQNEIVEFLNTKVDKVDKLVEAKNTKINKLEEYKKSLIYEYVTGKKEVS